MVAMGSLRAARPPPTRPATAPEPGRGGASHESHYRTRILGVQTGPAGSDRPGPSEPFRADRAPRNQLSPPCVGSCPFAVATPAGTIDDRVIIALEDDQTIRRALQ